MRKNSYLNLTRLVPSLLKRIRLLGDYTSRLTGISYSLLFEAMAKLAGLGTPATLVSNLLRSMIVSEDLLIEIGTEIAGMVVSFFLFYELTSRSFRWYSRGRELGNFSENFVKKIQSKVVDEKEISEAIQVLQPHLFRMEKKTREQAEQAERNSQFFIIILMITANIYKSTNNNTFKAGIVADFMAATLRDYFSKSLISDIGIQMDLHKRNHEQVCAQLIKLFTETSLTDSENHENQTLFRYNDEGDRENSFYFSILTAEKYRKKLKHFDIIVSVIHAFFNHSACFFSSPHKFRVFANNPLSDEQLKQAILTVTCLIKMMTYLNAGLCFIDKKYKQLQWDYQDESLRNNQGILFYLELNHLYHPSSRSRYPRASKDIIEEHITAFCQIFSAFKCYRQDTRLYVSLQLGQEDQFAATTAVYQKFNAEFKQRNLEKPHHPISSSVTSSARASVPRATTLKSVSSPDPNTNSSSVSTNSSLLSESKTLDSDALPLESMQYIPSRNSGKYPGLFYFFSQMNMSYLKLCLAEKTAPPYGLPEDIYFLLGGSAKRQLFFLHEEESQSSEYKESEVAERSYAKLFCLSLDPDQVEPQYFDTLAAYLQRNNSKHVAQVHKYIEERNEYAFYKVRCGEGPYRDCRTYGFPTHRYTRMLRDGRQQDVQVYEFSYFQVKSHKTEQRARGCQP